MAVRQEDVEREDLQSSVGLMPAFEPVEQYTDQNMIIQNEDGSIDVQPLDMVEEEGFEVHHDRATEEDWNENLAGNLSEQERSQVADRLCEFLEIDEQARKMHFERMKDAIKLLGISSPDERDGQAPFEGASVVTHPLIAEAVTQFQARAIEELMPASGPVKAAVFGKATPERIEQGKRIEQYMNYQFTEQDEDHFWHTDQMLFYLGLSGTAFKKAMPDPVTKMIVSRFVKDHDFIVPYNAKSLSSAPRYCHRYAMWENDVRRAKENGTFLEDAREPDVGSNPENDGYGQDRTEFEDKADDRTPAAHYDDTVSTILEYHIDFRLKWDDKKDIAPPYIITVDKQAREVLAIRRNWRMEDETKKRRLWFSMYRYLPGIGFYGMGMLHIIGNLAKAAGGAMRALLDAAAFANFQGGFKAKGGTNLSGERRLQPGVWADVDATTEDLAKMFYTPPFKEPSPALAQMLELMVEEGRRYLTTTENMVGEASNTGPVGTTLALIEQGSKVFSAVHKRMHVSARREYKMLAELNFEFMPCEEYPYEVEGEDRMILRQDFDGRVDVVPVSDPNIWSSTQRIAQAQAAVELMTSDPELYSVNQRREAHRRLLSALKVQDVDKLLPEKKDLRLDPVAENMNMMVGKAAMAYYEQDHDAHIAVHTNFGQSMMAKNPDLVAELEPIMRAHLMEHHAFKYRQEVETSMGMQLPPYDMHDEGEEHEELPPEMERQVAQAVAAKMQPPPEAQEQPDPEAEAAAAEAKAVEDQSDALTVGKLERASAEAQQVMANDQQAFEAEEARKQAAFEAEQARERAEFEAKQKRDADTAVTGSRQGMLDRISKRQDAKVKEETKPKPAAKAKPKSKEK